MGYEERVRHDAGHSRQTIREDKNNREVGVGVMVPRNYPCVVPGDFRRLYDLRVQECLQHVTTSLKTVWIDLCDDKGVSMSEERYIEYRCNMTAGG